MTTSTPSHIVEDQTEALAFLARSSAYQPRVERVERIDTHGSIVFLAGERVYKVKRAAARLGLSSDGIEADPDLRL